MRFVSYTVAGERSFGVVRGDGVVDLGRRHRDRWPTLKRLLIDDAVAEAGEASARHDADHALADIVFDPVVTDPGKIICVGANYRAHVAEMERTPTSHPVLFSRWPDTQIGHRAPLIRPPESTELDYEGEIAVVIGRPGRRIPDCDALAHVAGYSCYNDVTVRDWQRHTSQFLPGKNFPATGAFGPWMSTPEEMPKRDEMIVTTTVNGEVVQQAAASHMIASVERVVAYCSAFTPLAPGDVLVTGTPGGVGCKREPPLWLDAGDEVSVTVTGVGTLTNTVILEPDPPTRHGVPGHPMAK